MLCPELDLASQGRTIEETRRSIEMSGDTRTALPELRPCLAGLYGWPLRGVYLYRS